MSYQIDQSSSREVSWRDRKDIQGIPWNTSEMDCSREEMRVSRLYEQTFRNCLHPLDFLRDPSRVSSPFYSFFHNYARPHCQNGHFQLRNNVKFQNSIYFLNDNLEIEEFCPHSGRSWVRKTSLNYNIVVFDIKDQFLASGGYDGELMVKDLSSGVEWNMLPNDNTDLLNSCKLFTEGNNLYVLSSSNDCKVRVIDVQDPINNTQVFDFPCPVNCAAIREHLIAGALDSIDVNLVDKRTNSVVREFKGHQDYVFGIDWHPLNDSEFATASQDQSVRIWDIRKETPVHTLCGIVGAVYKVEYSACASYLAFLEAIDFVHIYDTRNFNACQVIDLFGELTGFAFSAEHEPQSLFVGVTDHSYKSLVEFRRSDLIDKIDF